MTLTIVGTRLVQGEFTPIFTPEWTLFNIYEQALQEIEALISQCKEEYEDRVTVSI